MNSQSKSVRLVAVTSGRVNTQAKKVRIPEIADFQPVSKPDDIRLDPAELRMILSYRKMLPRYQVEVSRIVDGLTEIPGALRFKAPVLRLVTTGDAS